MVEKVNSTYYTLITGASQGIGKALAIESAQQKQNLILVSLPETGLLDLENDLVSIYSIDCHCIEMDLCVAEAPQKIYDYILKENLNVNTLINNAGVGYVGPFEDLDTSWVQKLIQLNNVSLSVLTHLLIPHLSINTPAYVLNIGSLASLSPLPFKSLYSASKAFVYYFSKGLQRELRNKNIHISVVMPGSVPTNKQTLKRIEASGKKAKLSTTSPQQVAQYALKRMHQKKTVIIPGKFNQIATFIQRIIPEKKKISIAERMFKDQNIN